MDILDDQQVDESSDISLYARARGKQTGLWMIIASACALAILFFFISLIVSDHWWRYWRAEELTVELLLVAMVVKYILGLVTGIRTRKAMEFNDRRKLVTAAKLYYVLWIVVGMCSTVFLTGMILYYLADVKLFGDISQELFNLKRF